MMVGMMMMRASGSSSHLRSTTNKVSGAALLGCLALMLLVLVYLLGLAASNITPEGSLATLQLSSYADKSSASPIREPHAARTPPADKEDGKLTAQIMEKLADIYSNADADAVTTAAEEEKRSNDDTAIAIDDRIATLKLEYEHNGGTDQDADADSSRTERAAGPSQISSPSQTLDLTTQKPQTNYPTAEIPPASWVSSVMCDFTQPRSDTCSIDGDVRVIGKSSTIVLASPLSDSDPSHNTTWKIRPYPRKWEPTIDRIKELTVTLPAGAEQPPPCAVHHRVPAVFFSTGGFVGNYFHDFTDVLIPLFMTARRFNGEVQLVVTDYNHPFMDKYRRILRQLSRYPPINLDADDGTVHCFPQAHIGLFSHRALGIDTSRSPNGISMEDFREFLRKCFSLKRRYSRGISVQSRSKPRLLLILRKGSRAFVNEREVMKMVKGMGFKLITAGPEDTKNVSRFAQLVNSADVLMGVHGAGLTNMVFLPSNATLVQIIPCCELADGCRYIFAEPAPAMGINYVEYEIRVEESSLIEQYKRDHAVFRDPLSIQKQQGFNAFWNIFLNTQKGLVQQQRTRTRDWRSLALMQPRGSRSNRIKMMDLEMKMLNGFLIFFVIFWMWGAVGRRSLFLRW